MTTRWHILFITAVIITVFGCSSGTTGQGSGPETADDQNNAQQGDDFPDPYNISEPEDDPPETDDPQPPTASGAPGRLRIKVMALGQVGRAKVRIIAKGSREVVGSGEASKTYDVPSGEYQVDVTLEDAVDRPQKRLSSVVVHPGDLTTEEVAFTVVRVKMRPRQGKRFVGKEIRWRYAGGGDWFEETSMAGEEVILSAGHYDAEIMVRKRAITVTDIHVYEGQKTIAPQVTMR